MKFTLSTGIRKVCRYVSVSLLAFLSILMLVSAVFSLFYEKAAIGYLQRYMDDHLLTQVTMNRINIRLLTGFPNIAFDMKNVVVLSGEDFSPGDFTPGDAADTLLSAEKISFRFNLLKAFSRVFELKKIDVKNGYINILSDSDNHRNTGIWKNSSNQVSEYSFQLSNINLDYVDIHLIELNKGLEINTRGDKIRIRGSFTPGNIFATAAGDLHLNYLAMSGSDIVQNINLQLDLTLDYTDSILEIKDSRIDIDRIPVHLNSVIDNSEYTIAVSIPEINTETIISLLKLNPSFTGKYKTSGNLAVDASLSGDSRSNKSNFTSSFNLSDGSVTNDSNGSKISRIEFSGTASGLYPGKIKIAIPELISSVIKGSTLIEYDSNNNIITFNEINSSLNLTELTSFFNGSPIAEGIVKTAGTMASISVKEKWKSSAFEFVRHLKKGHLSFEDLKIHYGNRKLIEKIEGEVDFSENIYTIGNASLKAGLNTFNINGTASDLYNYLVLNDTLKADININLTGFDLTEFFTRDGNEDNSGNILPQRLNISANLNSDEFIVNKFHAGNLTINMHLIENNLNLNNFNFNSFDGVISGNAEINTSNSGGFSITCNTISSKVNISELFTAFNNFAQTFIIDKNIAGSLDGTISFYSEWDENINLKPAQISAIANVTILNGELIDFEPMMQLSKYFDARELEHVRFNTLKNIINIKDRGITIPEMTINSNAFNIMASGTHSFDHNFDYRFKVLLSEVLFNKARNKRKEINEFYISRGIEDRFTIPLIVAGTPDNFNVQFDKQRAFSLAGDESEKKPAPGKEVSTQEFVIEWDEPRDTIITERNRPGENDFIIDW